MNNVQGISINNSQQTARTDTRHKTVLYMERLRDVFKGRFQKAKDNLIYIDTDGIPGFFLILKNHIFTARSEDTIFIFHMCRYWRRHGY